MDKRAMVVISVIALFVLLASLSSYFVLAAETNTKSYDSDTRTVTIKNADTEIAKIKLNTPLVYSVIRGKDRLVAEFTINNVGTYVGGVLDKIDFYDIKDNNRAVTRNFVYKYKVLTETRDIPIYKQVCGEDITNANGSVSKNCVYEQIGTNKKNFYEWKDFTSSDLSNFKTGETTIGIFTDVYKGDYIEWIPTLYGVRIEEWAIWTEGLNGGLVAYYGMNDGNKTKVQENVFGVYNLSFVGDSRWDTNGKNFNATNNTGTIAQTGLQSVTFNSLDGESDATINFWINLTKTPDYPLCTGGAPSFLCDVAVASDGSVLLIGVLANLSVTTAKSDGSWYNLVGKNALTGLNKWNMITITFKGTNTTQYINGVYDVSGSQSATMGTLSGLDLLGGIGQNWKGMTGIMDEVGIWNRTLSASEVSSLYDEGLGTFYSIEHIPSVPILLSPANNSGFANGSTIIFTWSNSTDANGDVITYDLEIYNESDMASSHLVHSNYSITEGSANTSISIKLSNYIARDDDYYWRVRANDSTSLLSDWSEVRHFQYANWTIMFNLTDSVTGQQINTAGTGHHFDISCNNGFNIDNVKNPYTATDNFYSGMWECNFSDLIAYGGQKYFNEVKSFNANNDTTVQVSMSQESTLTQEEHDWLEKLYDCIINGNCAAYDLWEGTWKRITKTDRAVVTQETFISSTLNSGSNISLNYTINIPYKEGYADGEYLPLRLFFWFTNISNTKCYNQDKETNSNRVENPYCFPLVAETLGPNNGTVKFRVDLKPSLSDGTYNITRAIEIDPIIGGEQIWTNYGQENIGQIKVEESNNNPSINIDNKETRLTNKGFLTGAITGISQLLSGWQIVIIVSIIGAVLVVLIISKTILKLKR